MLFNSLTFLVFFALVLALHNAPLPWKVKKTNLLLASYLFYAAWNPPFVILLWISTAVDWRVAKKIYAEDRLSRRRAWVAVSVLVNLGLLGYFKYGEFLLENWQVLMSAMGVTWTPPDWDIVLPVGISFYTFQTMAYSLDVYLRRAKPADSLLDFALFVTFFPQLVAGPIVRPTQLIPQFQKPVRASRDQLLWGLGLMTLGLFEKIVIADGALAPAADAVFGASQARAVLGRVARNARVRRADFLGFCGLLDGGDWRGAVPRVLAARQLPVPVRRDWVLGLLASLAHLALDLAARLPLHPAWREPERLAPHAGQPDGHDAAWWACGTGQRGRSWCGGASTGSTSGSSGFFNGSSAVRRSRLRSGSRCFSGC